MATEALVTRVKEILALAKAGKQDEAYAAYKDLFLSAEFASYPHDERRHAIKLVVNVKVPPNRPAPSMVTAYKSAMTPLKKMVEDQSEPQDHELLGICYVVAGDEKKAAEHFRLGLQLERAKNPQSDLCGSLMKWNAAV